MDRLEGLKPPTRWIEASRSIQLSYRRSIGGEARIRTSVGRNAPLA